MPEKVCAFPTLGLFSLGHVWGTGVAAELLLEEWNVAMAAALSMLAACCNEGTGESCLWLIVGMCHVAMAATMVPGGVVHILKRKVSAGLPMRAAGYCEDLCCSVVR
jgi:hypothetical protein